MSTTFGPPVVLAGPLPAPLPYGLFSAATLVEGADERWGNGANIRGYAEGPANAWDHCATGTFRVKDIPEQPASPFFSAFAVYLADQCSGRGVGSDSALEGRARAAFASVEQAAVEREFATGSQIPSNPYLGDSNVTVLGGGAVGPEEGLALLEGAIGLTGRQGVIHAGRDTASVWSDYKYAGDHLLTRLGTPVAAGGGYVGVVPDGQAALSADQGWAFATGAVEVRRSAEIEIVPGSLAEALDRATNLVTYIAERNYLVVWDTQLQAAVLVDRSL